MSASTASKKAKKPTTVPSHPTYQVMISAAIVARKERNGSSRQAILKYIKDNYKVGDNVVNQVRLQLPKLVKGDKLIQTKGKGASGSFKVAKAAEPKKKKPAAPKKKVAVKKDTKKKPVAKKTAAKKKSDGEKKSKKAAPKAAAKKPASKKASPKKKTSVKKAAAKKPAARKTKKPAAKKAKK